MVKQWPNCKTNSITSISPFPETRLGRVFRVHHECADSREAKLTLVKSKDATGQDSGKGILANAESVYRLLIETMREGLAIDDENERIVYANDAFAKMLGYSPSELVGKNWVELTTKKDHKMAKDRIRNRKDGKSERYEMEWVNRRGEVVPTIIAAAPYFDSKGKFVGSFAVITEISEQKDAEETVQFYLDLITHDIANQLQVIMMSAGLLEQNLPPSYIDDARHDILDAVERCNRLITKTKRAGQIRGIPNASVDLSSAIKEKIGVLERVYEAKVHVEGFDSPVRVKADSLLGELLWNVLENAAGHNTKEDKQVWVSGQREGQWFRLSIADNGPGISGEKKKSLFDRAKRFGGVGLALVAQMVHKYGARIEVQDRVSGKVSSGANFIITFEISEPV